MASSPFARLDAELDTLVEAGISLASLSSLVPSLTESFAQLPAYFRVEILRRFVPSPPDPVGQVITELFSHPSTEPYFRAMGPLAYFYWSWLEEHAPHLEVDQRDALATSMIYGAIGYKLFDQFQDNAPINRSLDSSTLYLAKQLISQQETELRSHFLQSTQFPHFLDHYNRLYANFGLSELACRGRANPIAGQSLLLLGHKSAPLFLYYALALEATGRLEQLSEYESLFFTITTVIQIQDDLADAVEDLSNGQITVATEDFFTTRAYAETKGDPARLEQAYQTYLTQSGHDTSLLKQAVQLCDEATTLAERLQDDVFQLFILLKKLTLLEKLNL